MMGVWSSTLFGSGGAIQWQRWQGTLELLVGAPRAVHPRPPADHARDSATDRHLLDRRRRSSGAASSSASRSTSCTRSPSWSSIPAMLIGLGLLGLLLAVELHPLPARERALEPARVPDLARHRAARARCRSSPAGSSRSPGCSRRPGGSARSATLRSAATRWPRSAMCLALLGVVYLALAAVFLRDVRAPGPRPARPSR